MREYNAKSYSASRVMSRFIRRKAVEKDEIQQQEMIANTRRRKDTAILYRVNIRQLIRSFMKKMNEDRIAVYSAQAAFSLVLSAIPILFLLLTILKFTPLTEDVILDTLSPFLVPDVQEKVRGILGNVYQGSFTFLSFAALSLIWAAGGGIMGLTNGLHSIYSVKENRNYLFLRLRSSLYALFLVLALILALGVLVFEVRVREWVVTLFPLLGEISGLGEAGLIIFALAMMTLLFCALYTFLPNRKIRFFSQIYGAVFTTVSWCIFSFFFSVYLAAAKNLPVLYGGMITFMVLLFWLQICLLLFFFGAEFNAWIENPDSFPF